MNCAVSASRSHSGHIGKTAHTICLCNSAHLMAHWEYRNSKSGCLGWFWGRGLLTAPRTLAVLMNRKVEFIQRAVFGGDGLAAYPTILRIFGRHATDTRNADRRVPYSLGSNLRRLKLFGVVIGSRTHLFVFGSGFRFAFDLW
jgi:hypothetical protein